MSIVVARLVIAFDVVHNVCVAHAVHAERRVASPKCIMQMRAERAQPLNSVAIDSKMLSRRRMRRLSMVARINLRVNSRAFNVRNMHYSYEMASLGPFKLCRWKIK